MQVDANLLNSWWLIPAGILAYIDAGEAYQEFRDIWLRDCSYQVFIFEISVAWSWTLFPILIDCRNFRMGAAPGKSDWRGMGIHRLCLNNLIPIPYYPPLRVVAMVNVYILLFSGARKSWCWWTFKWMRNWFHYLTSLLTNRKSNLPKSRCQRGLRGWRSAGHGMTGPDRTKSERNKRKWWGNNLMSRGKVGSYIDQALRCQEAHVHYSWIGTLYYI